MEGTLLPRFVRVPAGTCISAPIFPIYRHFGIVTECGLVMSCSARAGRAVQEAADVFSGGFQWRIEPRPSDLPWWVVLQRGRQFADRPYHLTDWNCECFVNACYGLPPRSQQAELTIAAAGLGLIAFAAYRMA
jgi:hypothetical protein